MSKTARRRWLDAAVIAAALALAGLLSWAAIAIQVNRDRIDVLAQALADEQSAAQSRGQEPVAPEPEDLIRNPDYPGPAVGPLPPTDEQVYAAVEAYFTAHPVEADPPSPAAIAVAVAAYLEAHPPERGEPGPGPSPEQVAAAVERYLTAHPPPAGAAGRDGADGTDGRDGGTGPAGPRGDPGRPPTAEEIAAAVEAWMRDNPLPVCPTGSSPQAHTVVTGSGPVDAVICAANHTEE